MARGENMKKQSVWNRRYIDRLKKEEPEKAKDLRYRQYRSSSKSFILRRLKAEDISDFEEYLKERKRDLKYQDHA